MRIDLNTGHQNGRFELPEGLRAPHGVQLRPTSERELFVNAEVASDIMVVFDTRTGAVLRQFPLPAATHNFIFSHDGNAVLSFAGKQGVSRLDAKTGRLIAHADLGSPARGLRLLGKRGLAVAGKGEVLILDVITLQILRRIKAPVNGQLAYLETLPDGTIVAPSLSDDGVVIFGKTGSARFVATGKTALVVRASPDGRIYVANVLDEHLSVIDNGLTARSIGKVQGPNGMAFGRCPRQ
jgi:streptogramin lyase